MLIETLEEKDINSFLSPLPLKKFPILFKFSQLHKFAPVSGGLIINKMNLIRCWENQQLISFSLCFAIQRRRTLKMPGFFAGVFIQNPAEIWRKNAKICVESCDALRGRLHADSNCPPFYSHLLKRIKAKRAQKTRRFSVTFLSFRKVNHESNIHATRFLCFFGRKIHIFAFWHWEIIGLLLRCLHPWNI